MAPNFLTGVLMPVALAVIMFGLGLSLTGADFRRVVLYPRAVVVGLTCQTLILPAAALLIAQAFELPAELAVGLMLLAASPGGATANLFSHLAHGDVALNVTLTAVNSLLSLVTLPIIVGFSMAHFMGEGREIPVQFSKVIEVCVIILVPIFLGMGVRRRNPDLATRLDKPVRSLSAFFLLLVIVAAVAKERANLPTYFQQVGLAALAFNLLSMAVGYVVPRLARLPEKQAVAISMEIGIHNGTLAITIAGTVLANSVMTIPAAVYSLIMFVTAGLFAIRAKNSLVAQA